MIQRALAKLARDESGHAGPALADIVGSAGAIILAVGAASSEDAVIIVGGVVLAVGIFASGFLRHVALDYSIFDRLNKLEGKSDDD